MDKYYLGIDIGGTKCAAVLGCMEKKAGEKPLILGRREVPTMRPVGREWETVPPDEMLKRLAELSEELMAEAGVKTGKVNSVGISCGGPLSSRRGLILSPPNLPGWDEVPAVSILEEALGIPVYLQNDANAGALAEWRYGAARGTENCIFLTFGTGLGAGLILNGRLYSGTNDMAGEIGHIRLAEAGPFGYGKEGSLEGFCSGGGIGRMAGMPAKEAAKAARRGDVRALRVFTESAEYLGRGISILIDLLNPEIIVIGSVYARNEDLFRDRVWEVIRREALAISAGVCRIVPAELKEGIGDYAALAVAMTGTDESENT